MHRAIVVEHRLRVRVARPSGRLRAWVASTLVLVCFAPVAACSPARAGPAARVGPRGRYDLPVGGKTRAVLADVATTTPHFGGEFGRALSAYDTQVAQLGQGPAGDRVEAVRAALETLSKAIAVLPLGDTLDLGDTSKELSVWIAHLEGVTPSSREGTEAAKVALEVAAATLREAARGPYGRAPRVRAAVDALDDSVAIIELDRPIAEMLVAIEGALRTADDTLHTVQDSAPDLL